MLEGHALAALQSHTNGRNLVLPATARELRRDLRTVLVKAHRAGKIVTSMDDIERRVTLLDEDQIKKAFGKLFKELEARKAESGAFCLFGGVKNQARDSSLPHFSRNDGAWFDFSITVRETGSALVLLAYDFEIRFPPGNGAPFLRFDLNLPDHRNEERDLRCHLHPGSDDVLVPAPLMSPAEVLTLFIDVGRSPAGRKRRSLTAFEVGWLKHSFEHASQAHRNLPVTPAP